MKVFIIRDDDYDSQMPRCVFSTREKLNDFVISQGGSLPVNNTFRIKRSDKEPIYYFVIEELTLDEEWAL